MAVFLLRRRSIAVAFVGLLIFAVGVAVGMRLELPREEQETAAAGQIFTNLTLEYGNGDSQSFPNEALPVGATVLDQLKAVEVRYGLPVETRSFPGIGEFVEGIHGVRNTNTRYWQFWVNDAYAEVGASQFVLREGDRVLWKRTDER